MRLQQRRRVLSNVETKLQTKELDRLLRTLKAPNATIRVGILGSKDSRSGKENSNASVGAAHELGTSKMPKRSFLETPLRDNLSRYLKKSGLFTEDLLKKALADGKVLPLLKAVGVAAEAVVQDAFATGGFGKWAPWKGSYTSKTGQILVNSQQLRTSITSDVKED